MQYGFHFDAWRCTGCKTCVLACKDYQDNGTDVAYRQVYEYVGGSWGRDERGLWCQGSAGGPGADESANPDSSSATGGATDPGDPDKSGASGSGAASGVGRTCFAWYVSVACNHCARPVCVEVCPTGAMHKDAESGLVSVNARRCVGCGYCALSCPYHAPKVDRAAGRSVKCDGCLGRIAAGLAPICVAACPVRALEFGEIGALRQRYGELADLAPLPDSGDTEPSLVITPPKAAELRTAGELASGTIANLREIV